MTGPTTNRREFGCRVAGAAVTALAAASLPAADRPPDPMARTLEGLMRMIEARHGDSLSAEQLKDVARSVYRSLYAAEQMKKVPLANSDEPAFAFRADVPRSPSRD